MSSWALLLLLCHCRASTEDLVVVASTSFEKPSSVTGPYYDHYSHEWAHRLKQQANAPTVYFSGDADEMGFTTYYENTLGVDTTASVPAITMPVGNDGSFRACICVILI